MNWRRDSSNNGVAILAKAATLSATSPSIGSNGRALTGWSAEVNFCLQHCAESLIGWFRWWDIDEGCDGVRWEHRHKHPGPAAGISNSILWVSANDGELGWPVKPLPYGWVGSNPTLPTNASVVKSGYNPGFVTQSPPFKSEWMRKTCQNTCRLHYIKVYGVC